MSKMEPLLSVNDLSVSFSMYEKMGFKKHNMEVVHSVGLDINPGEIVAIIGSSGSGKSILAQAILGLLPGNAVVSGSISYDGKSYNGGLGKELLGRDVSYIPQGVDFLDPLMKAGKQVQGLYGSPEKVDELFDKYQLARDAKDKYPFELSGGMARRIFIAGALINSPRLVIADEPTPGLDEKLAKETLEDLKAMAANGTAVLLITHDIDLGVAVADRVAVFYDGTIIELAAADELSHPYSRALVDALPQNNFFDSEMMPREVV